MVYGGLNENEDEFAFDLARLTEIYSDYINLNFKVIIIGDFNTDTARKDSHSKKLNEFLATNQLKLLDTGVCHHKTYTHKRKTQTGWIKSWIDHICANPAHIQLENISIFESTDNFSDHNPISFTFVDTESQIKKKVILKNKKRIPNWLDQVFITKYNERFEIGLKTLDSKIKNIEKEKDKTLLKIQITALLNDITSLAISSTEKALNETKTAKTKHSKSKSWWCETLHCLYSIMKQKYIEYQNSEFDRDLKIDFNAAKREFRRRKRYNLKLKRDHNIRKLDKMFKLNRMEFWKHLKKLKNIKNNIDMSISEMQAQIQALFNNFHKLNPHLEKKIENEFNQINQTSKMNSCYSLSDYSIENVLSQLKNGKRTGIGGLTNEMLKYAHSTRLSKFLKILFEKIIFENVMPFHFNMAIVKLLVKDTKKPTNNISNLRPLSISDAFSYIYELLIMNEILKKSETNAKQFGFKKNCSCAHATFVLTQTINYNNKLGKKTYITAIDASKAFDKINRQNLWIKMHKKLINPQFINSLINYYDISFAIIENDEEYSQLFKTTVGLKQGGPASPNLFSFYVDDLISQIEKSNTGTYLGNIKIDILMYADDILIITDSKVQMQKALDIVTLYGESNFLKFNAEKTCVMVSSPRFKTSLVEAISARATGPLMLDSKPIETVPNMKYLGIHISNDNKPHAHLVGRKNATINSITKLENLCIVKESTDPLLKLLTRDLIYFLIL